MANKWYLRPFKVLVFNIYVPIIRGSFQAILQNTDGLKPQQRKYIDISEAPDRVKQIYDLVVQHYKHFYSYRL
jgi:hypothetical protein